MSKENKLLEIFSSKEENKFQEMYNFQAEQYNSSEIYSFNFEIKKYEEIGIDVSQRKNKTNEENIINNKKQNDVLKSSLRQNSVMKIISSITSAATIIVLYALTISSISVLYNVEDYIDINVGMDYFSLTIDMEGIKSENEGNFVIGDYYIEISIGDETKKIDVIDGKNTYLVTGLEPDRLYKYNFMGNDSNDEITTYYTGKVNTKTFSEVTGVYDDLNSSLTFDEHTKTARLCYSVYLSNYNKEYLDASFYICNNKQANIDNIKDLLHTNKILNEDDFFKGTLEGITSDEIYLYIIAINNNQLELLFEKEIKISYPETWGKLNSPVLIVNSSTETSTLTIDTIKVDGTLDLLDNTYRFIASVKQYNNQNTELANEYVDVRIDSENMTYSLITNAYYGVKTYQYVICYVDENNELIEVYTSNILTYDVSQQFNATYTKVSPSEALIEYYEGYIKIKVDPQFTSSCSNLYYKLEVTNSDGILLGQYSGTEEALIVINDYQSLDIITFEYIDCGRFVNSEKEYSRYQIVGSSFSYPEVTFFPELRFNGNYFEVTYECNMIYDLSNASMDLFINTSTNSYTKHISSVLSSDVLVLDMLSGEDGEMTITGILTFKDNQADNAIHEININQAFYTIDYQLITKVTVDLNYELQIYGEYDGTLPVTLDFSYYLPSDYKIKITEAVNSIDEEITLTNSYNINLNEFLGDGEIVIQVLDALGEPCLEPQTFVVSKSLAKENYVSPTTNSVNPYDAVVTYNSDGTINIYRNMMFSSSSPNIYYNARLVWSDEESASDDVIVKYYDIIGTDKYAIIENIPNRIYSFVYDYLFDYNGVTYLMYEETPSGTIYIKDENFYAEVSRDGISTNLSIVINQNGELDNRIKVNDIEYTYTSYDDVWNTNPQLIIDGEIEIISIVIYHSSYSTNYDAYLEEIEMLGTKYREIVVNELI